MAVTSEHHADELAATLHDEFPWMAVATEQLWHDMRRSVRDGLPGLRIRPLLLDGVPGIGKSVWARRLAELINAPTLTYEATNESASFGLVGSQKAWGNASPGRLINLIIERRVGNPVVVLDEIDKAVAASSTKGQSFDLPTALLPLLEAATARRWSCPFFEVPLDMSWVIWVLTSNNWRCLPEPLLSRCPPICLPALTLPNLIGFVHRQGRLRALTDISVEVMIQALQMHSRHPERLSLRTAIRLLDRAAVLEAAPSLH